ncbi:MAG TPA: hypothetical protein VFG68_17165 [Fimbriiglobus sp.]|nr:hypothetical protein [Fimbriiglobus sp.]
MIRLAASLVALGLLTLVGCGPSDKVQSYAVPKSNESAGAETAKGDYRILGAMFPADKPAWFFKLTGKADALAAQEAAFDKFLASVKFPDGPAKPPTYDLPDGWKSDGARGMRADTIHLGAGDNVPEISVIAAMGGAKENVARWAGQVGSKADFAAATKEITSVGGVKGLCVDVTGPKDPAAAGGPFMRGR